MLFESGISSLVGDGAVQITDCATCQTIGSLRGHTGNVMSVFAGDGDIVATGSTDNTLRLWDLRSHRCIDVILVGDSSPASVALSCNGSYLASGKDLPFCTYNFFRKFRPPQEFSLRMGFVSNIRRNMLFYSILQSLGIHPIHQNPSPKRTATSVLQI